MSQNTLNNSSTLSNNPLAAIMADVVRIENEGRSVPHMIAYCIMVANKDRREMDKDAPTLRQICSMSKGDKSKETNLLASLLLGYADKDELIKAQADGQTVTEKDDAETASRKETNSITVAQYNALRARLSRMIYEAADLIDAGVSTLDYEPTDRCFYTTTRKWLVPGMTAHGALAINDQHKLDGRMAYALVDGRVYPFQMNTGHLGFIKRLEFHMRNGDVLADTPLSRMLCKANTELKYVGQQTVEEAAAKAAAATAAAAAAAQAGTSTTPEATPPVSTPPVPAPSATDDVSNAPRGPEPTPPAYTVAHYRKLVADWISASTLFVTECGKIARPVDMVTDDFEPHWKDFNNTVSTLNAMRTMIIENTARVDAEHASQLARNLEAARAKAFEKAPATATAKKQKPAAA